MALIDEFDEYRRYSYECTELDLTFVNGDKSEMLSLKPMRLSSMSISSNYTRDLFPVFHIQLILEPSVYYKILENKNRSKIHIRIDKFYRLIGEDTKSLYAPFLNQSFDFILDDDDSDMYETMKLEQKSMDYENVNLDDSNDLIRTRNKVEFYIYKADDVDPMDTDEGLNTILQNATVQDAFQYVLSTIGFRNYMMGKMDNTKTYKSLYIPKLKARQVLRFLDSYYGTWKSGMMAFCDYDRSYFMPFTSECTVYESGENRETCIIIPDNTYKYNNDVCSLYRDNSSAVDYIIADNKSTSIRNESISNEYLNSSGLTTVNSLTGDIKRGQTNVNTRNRPSSRVEVNRTENEWLTDIHSKFTSTNNKVIELSISNYDIAAIKPNRKYTVYFTNTKTGKKNKGNYILTQAEHFFMKGSSEFDLTSHIVLRLDS